MSRLCTFCILGCAALAATVQAQQRDGAAMPLPSAALPPVPFHEEPWRGDSGLLPQAPAPYRQGAAGKREMPQFGGAHGARAADGAGPMLHLETVPPTPGALMNQRPSHRWEVYRFGPDSSVLLAGRKGGMQVLLRVYTY